MSFDGGIDTMDNGSLPSSQESSVVKKELHTPKKRPKPIFAVIEKLLEGEKEDAQYKRIKLQIIQEDNQRRK